MLLGLALVLAVGFEPVDAARVREVAREMVELLRHAPARLRVARKLCVAERLQRVQALEERVDALLKALNRDALGELADLRRRAEWLRAEASGCVRTPGGAPPLASTETVVTEGLPFPRYDDPTRPVPPGELSVRVPAAAAAARPAATPIPPPIPPQ